MGGSSAAGPSLSTSSSGAGAQPKRNRNKKGLALGAASAKPGTLSNTSASDVLAGSGVATANNADAQGSGAFCTVSASRRASGPVEVQKTHRTIAGGVSVGSGDSIARPDASPLLPTTPSLSSSSTASVRSAYHNKLSEQLATLELGVEFKLDLKNEDLQVLDELGSGNGGTVSRVLHVPTKAVMAKKVLLDRLTLVQVY